MKVGTKSLLFGVHQVIIHPIMVFIAWCKLFGFPKDPRLWVAFFVHDLGYWGKPNMDGKEGETHVELGARIMHKLFDPLKIKQRGYPGYYGIPITRIYDNYWYNFTLYHSRFYAKTNNAPISKLSIADKYAFCVCPKWIYLPMARWSGEIYEYMDENKNRSGHSYKGEDDWFEHVRVFMENWVKDEMDKLSLKF